MQVEKLTVLVSNSAGFKKQFERHYSNPDIREEWIDLYTIKAQENDLKLHFIKETIYVNQ